MLYKAADNGNVYVSYGGTVTPPGTANFTLSAQANNQNNPNVESADLDATSRSAASGTSPSGRLSLTGALFHTENKNVIFTVDATAVPPIYNQDDAQRVNGVTLGASGRITRQLAGAGELRVSRRDARVAERRHQRQSPDADAEVLRQRLDDLSPAGAADASAAASAITDDVFINAANTIQSPGYQLVDALAEYDVNTHLSAAAEYLQPHRRGLHPQRQQQRRPLQPGQSALGGAVTASVQVLADARMLLAIPDVLPVEQVRQARALLDARRLDRRPRHRRPAVGAGQGQPAAARGSSGRRGSSAT